MFEHFIDLHPTVPHHTGSFNQRHQPEQSTKEHTLHVVDRPAEHDNAVRGEEPGAVADRAGHQRAAAGRDQHARGRPEQRALLQTPAQHLPPDLRLLPLQHAPHPRHRRQRHQQRLRVLQRQRQRLELLLQKYVRPRKWKLLLHTRAQLRRRRFSLWAQCLLHSLRQLPESNYFNVDKNLTT